LAWQDTYADQIGSYTKDYVPSIVLAALATSHMLGIFFRLDSDPGLHIWCGVNDIPAGFDSIDEDTVYLGAGKLLNMPSLEVLVNGQASSASFGLSGIDAATSARLAPLLPDVRGKDVKVGITTLDDYFQPVSDIISLWTGTASHKSETSPPVPGGENPTTTLALAVVSGHSTRSRPSYSMWSPAHHKAEYPTDLFCDQTPRLARGVAPVWPPPS